MKKLAIFTFLLIMSIGHLVSAQTWAEYDTPASATAIAVTDNAIFVFTPDQYYQVGFPLPASGSTLPWAQMIVPGTGSIKAGVVTPDGIVFALRENGDLWRLINGQWENIFPDQVIEGLSGIAGNRFFAWSRYNIYEYLGGFTQMPFDGAKVITFNEDHVMVFTESSGNYSGSNSWTLSPAEDLNNFYPTDAAMTDDEYVVVGSVINSLAAWHQSPPDACVPFTHVLTEGIVNSVAATKDTAWAVGRIGPKGMLFNTSDMSEIYIVPENVWQVRNNNVGLVAAVSSSKLYVHGSTMIVGSQKTSTSTAPLIIAPNPIEDGCLRIIASEACEARLTDLTGRQLAGALLEKGSNNINISYLPTGMYLLNGTKIIVP
ncbi:MAG: T9SS type A sorting domain-containing protein [Patescibacteria group bacterium]|nr:T9SS type A sorting domain-containing protein [Patescibacteria group bacterium]